ncbi:MAG: hypothetical protein EBU90_24675 [Proteobacteria bacterium]|nr:hypothetical protein [Pseudomonadota bacterium]NBP16177.1 hypothetical protein [bacterium]
MAVQKYILKNTNQETVVKVSGSDGSVTITLNSDLIANTQVLQGTTQTVNIISANWTGSRGSGIVIARNGTTILPITADQPQRLDFSGEGYVDTVENTKDLTVSISGAEGVVYLVLRKVAGYATKIETAEFSVYDNTSVAGA